MALPQRRPDFAQAMRIALLCLALCACFRNPVTGKLQLDLLSESQEIETGQQARQEVAQTMGLYHDPRLEAYIADLGKPLAANSGRPQLPFSYQIVEDASVNAFALPGGPIFITRGILGHLNSEAELVAVMGHETGHVSARQLLLLHPEHRLEATQERLKNELKGATPSIIPS
jgi:predicted Zn-dependent protease